MLSQYIEEIDANANIDAVLANAEIRSELKENPQQTLSDHGIRLAEGVEVELLEGRDDRFYFVLPPDPNVDLSDEALSALAGGKASSFGTNTGLCWYP